MQKPEPIEAILARLMPPALSGEGLREMEIMIDRLAGEQSPPAARIQVPGPSSVAGPPNRWPRRIAAAGMAAAIAAMAVTFAPSPHSPIDAPVATVVSQVPMENRPEFVLVSESDRIESSTDEGWVEDSDGSTMRALRLNVVEENSIRDEETGIVLQVSEPREEILLMPISAF